VTGVNCLSRCFAGSHYQTAGAVGKTRETVHKTTLRSSVEKANEIPSIYKRGYLKWGEKANRFVVCSFPRTDLSFNPNTLTVIKLTE